MPVIDTNSYLTTTLCNFDGIYQSNTENYDGCFVFETFLCVWYNLVSWMEIFCNNRESTSGEWLQTFVHKKK